MSIVTDKFTDQDAAEIRAMTDMHLQAVLNHDPDAFLATCTDDITFLPPEQPPVVGRVACRRFLENFPTPKTFTAEIDDCEGQANLAFSRGSATAKFEDGTTTTFKWLGIHRRHLDGSWKIARDIWNTNSPS
ncbi:MAG: nuclear transport factor 2 family protein [Acidobacteria bacterium]|nr:nuclear transport factor 2 family protein [Acidobacteriota bacterium]